MVIAVAFLSAHLYLMKHLYPKISRNIDYLLDFGCNIEYSETARSGAGGEAKLIMSDFYYVHEFTDFVYHVTLAAISAAYSVFSEHHAKVLMIKSLL